MDLNLANGFIFLAVITGVGSLFSIVGTVIAYSDDEKYAGILTILSVSLSIVFLISGFMGFATK